MALEHAELDSSVLARASYDPDTEQLNIWFRNGRSYTHEGVPPDAFAGLCDAQSPGSYYNSAIKGVYS